MGKEITIDDIYWVIQSVIINSMKMKKLCISLLKLIFIVGPVILIVGYSFNPWERIQLSMIAINGTTISGKLSDEDIVKPGLKSMIQDIIQVPFDLGWYDICFTNSGTQFESKLPQSEGLLTSPAEVIIYFNNQTEKSIPPGETACFPYKINTYFSNKMSTEYVQYFGELSIGSNVPIQDTEFRQNMTEANITFEVKTYATPETNGEIAKIFLVFLAWSAIVLGLNELKNFIRGEKS